MLAHVRRLSGDVVIYGAGRMALQLLAFVTLPIFTHVFSPSEYGIIETITASTLVISLFTTLGLESASQRSYFDYHADDECARRIVLSTAFWTLLAWSTFLALLIAAVGGNIAGRLLGDPRYSLPLRIAVATIPATVITNFTQEILRLRHQPLQYSLLGFLGGSATVGLAVYLVAIAGWGLPGNYLGFFLGGLVTLSVGCWIVRDTIGLTFDRRELRVMLAYGLPLLPVAASTWVIQLADRFFLLHYASSVELGWYGLGVRLSNLLLFGVSAFGIAWAPFVLELHSRDAQQERLVRAQALTYVTLGLSFGAVCLSVFAREFFLIVTAPSFVNAYKVVGVLSMGIVAIGINSITITGISLSRQTHYFARYTLLTALLNIGLNFLLIPHWGMVGAALATALTYAALAGLYYWRAQRLDPVLYDVRRLLVIIVVAAVLITFGTFVNLDPVWLSIVIKMPLVLAFPAFVWLLGGFDPHALAYARNSFARTITRGRGTGSIG